MATASQRHIDEVKKQIRFNRGVTAATKAKLTCYEQLDFVYDKLQSLLSAKKIDQIIFASSQNKEILDDTMPKGIFELAFELVDICQKDPDPAIGSIIVDNHEYYSIKHSIHTAIMSEIVSKAIGMAENDRLSLIAAALTMNIAMIELQDTLHYQEDPLTAHQKTQVKMHPQSGVEILKNCNITDELWLRTVYQHHEVPDGSGYPLALKNEKILLTSKIVALADYYCAQVVGRDYRTPLLPPSAVQSIFKTKGNKIDQDLALTLINTLGIYPPGTLVRLKNNEAAVVTYRGKQANAPFVTTLPDLKSVSNKMGDIRDCSDPQFAIKEIIPLAASNIKLNRAQVWGVGEMYKKLRNVVDKAGIQTPPVVVKKEKKVRINIPAIAIQANNPDKMKGLISDLRTTGCKLAIPLSEKEPIKNQPVFAIVFKIDEKVVKNLKCRARSIILEGNANLVELEFVDLSQENLDIINEYVNERA